MFRIILALLLYVVAVLLFVLKRAYRDLPVIELKRRARSDDHRAHRLYRAAVYERELSLFFWLLIGIAVAPIPLLLTRSLPNWGAFLVILALTWFSITLFTLLNAPNVAKYLATWLAPFLARLLNLLHPIIGRLTRVMDRYSVYKPNDIYQTEDLLDLINQQMADSDNRIPNERLAMASRALTFGDVKVRTIMTPKRMMVTVDSSDSVGPVLMGELHKSGHSRFPVYESKPDNIVGTLYLKDIVDVKGSESVKKLMKKDVYYVHEEYNLERVLHAFLKTKHHLFIVVDKLEDVVGIVTIEDVLEQIIGKRIVDEFDKYEDLREVAKDLAKHEHAKRTEVIE